MMFTKAEFRKLAPDLLIQIIPLSYPPPRTTILCRIEDMLKKEYPEILSNYEQGILVLNTRKVVRPR